MIEKIKNWFERKWCTAFKLLHKDYTELKINYSQLEHKYNKLKEPMNFHGIKIEIDTSYHDSFMDLKLNGVNVAWLCNIGSENSFIISKSRLQNLNITSQWRDEE